MIGGKTAMNGGPCRWQSPRWPCAPEIEAVEHRSGSARLSGSIITVGKFFPRWRVVVLLGAARRVRRAVSDSSPDHRALDVTFCTRPARRRRSPTLRLTMVAASRPRYPQVAPTGCRNELVCSRTADGADQQRLADTIPQPPQQSTANAGRTPPPRDDHYDGISTARAARNRQNREVRLRPSVRRRRPGVIASVGSTRRLDTAQLTV